MLLTFAISAGAFALLAGLAWITYPGPVRGGLDEHSRGVSYFAIDTQKLINGYV